MKLLMILLILSSNAFAANNYITGIQKVTFRTGPGTDNKIIRMLESTSKVEVLEVLDKWTKVKDTEGDEGYVLSRFLTKDVPYNLRFEWLKSKFEKQKEQTQKIESEMQSVRLELKNTADQLDTTTKQLSETQVAFEELKSGSAEYLSLKNNYDKAVINLAAQNKKVDILERKLSQQNIQWFLAGGGVLLLGWLIGLISRKKKTSSGLTF